MAEADPSPGFKSEAVRAAYEFDRGPGRYRIGLIALDCDHATERDFMNMRPSDEIAIYTSRVRSAKDCTVENLRSIAPLLTEAAALILPESRLDVIAYSCTSGTVVVGHDAVAGYIRAARPGIACVTPIGAALAALTRLGARRIAVLTPYIDEVNGPIASCLAAAGIDVVGFTSFGLIGTQDMANLPPEAIYQAALEADRAEAEALFISCTAIRSVDVVEQIEEALDKPVVTSIQAMFWQSLGYAGYSKPIAGYGRLFRLDKDA